MTPKHKDSDAGNLDVPKKTKKFFFLGKNAKVYHRYVCIGKHIVQVGVATTLGFRYQWGALGTYSQQIKDNYYIHKKSYVPFWALYCRYFPKIFWSMG